MGTKKENVRYNIILDLLGESSVVRSRDLIEYGIPREYLSRMQKEGLIKKTGRGLYVRSDMKPSEHNSLVEAAKIVPKGVVCLLSALKFHDLTTESPYEVWMAIDNKAWKPQNDAVPLRIMRFSGEALTAGVEEHTIQGTSVRIYSPAKTVADCFKFRNKIGLDLAIESLKDCLQQNRCTIDQIWKYALICRVSNIMRPYLEALR